MNIDEGKATTSEAPPTVNPTPDTVQTEKAALEKAGVDGGKPVSNIQVEYFKKDYIPSSN